MAIFHVHASIIKKGSGKLAGGFARYLLTGDATRYRAYLAPAERQRPDLVESNSQSLPLWARDGEHFWTMASRYERKGGQVAFCYQFTLPRELSVQGRLALAADLRAAFVAQYPHTYAVHNPHTRTGEEQPHVHVMFSTRREDIPQARGPETWFRQAAPEGQYRIGAGVKKDHAWFHRLAQVRAESAVLINAALEREGLPYAVSALSLHARGIDRAHTPYDPGREQALNLAAWQRVKQRQHLDIDRQAILDVVRDRFWATDQSPFRVQQREESLERLLARVRQLERIRPWQEAPNARQDRLRVVMAGRARYAETVQQGLRMRLDTDEDERRLRYGR